MNTQYKISLKAMEDLDIARIFSENPESDVLVIQIDGTGDKIVAAKKTFLEKFDHIISFSNGITLAGEALFDGWGYGGLVPVTENTKFVTAVGTYLQLKLTHTEQDYRVRPSQLPLDVLIANVRHAKKFLNRKVVTVHAL